MEKMFYTVAEIEEILGVSRTTVYKLLNKREFSWITVGGKKYRILCSSFNKWLEENSRFNKNIIDEKDNFSQLCDKMSRRG